jgi:predicted nucleic acid-binding protein
MATYLIDKSALARMPKPAVRRRLVPILEAGEAATCALVDLEVLYSTRNVKEHAETRRRRALAYEKVALDDRIFDRAIEVQGKLARSGMHRLPIPDFLIAAAAEAAGLIVLHYDADFDTIASVTRQPTEWVVPRGSLP